MASSRRRTLLNLLRELVRYETRGGAHDSPPCADYAGRPAALADAGEVLDVEVIGDEAVVVTCVLDERRGVWDILHESDAHERSFSVAHAAQAASHAGWKREAEEEATPPAAAVAAAVGDVHDSDMPNGVTRARPVSAPAITDARQHAERPSKKAKSASAAPAGSLLAFPTTSGCVLRVLDATGGELLDDAGEVLALASSFMRMASCGAVRVEGERVRLPLRAASVHAPAHAAVEPCFSRQVLVLAAQTQTGTQCAPPLPLLDTRSRASQPFADALAALVAAAASAAPAPGGQLLLVILTCAASMPDGAWEPLRRRLDAAAAGRLDITLALSIGNTQLVPALTQQLGGYYSWLHGRGATLRLAPELVMGDACHGPTMFLRPRVPLPLLLGGLEATGHGLPLPQRPPTRQRKDVAAAPRTVEDWAAAAVDFRKLRPVSTTEALISHRKDRVRLLVDDVDQTRWVARADLAAVLVAAGLYTKAHSAGARASTVFSNLPAVIQAGGSAHYAGANAAGKAATLVAYSLGAACSIARVLFPENTRAAPPPQPRQQSARVAARAEHGALEADAADVATEAAPGASQHDAHSTEPARGTAPSLDE